MSDNRGQWGSKFGFIMAAAGSAVGLGNIWRFPYLTGQNGGGAFVVVYILCVVLVGAPVLMNEMALGRISRKNVIGTFTSTGGNKFWTFMGGVLALCVSFFVLSYYTVIAGWTIGYMGTSILNQPIPFKEFIAAPEYVIPLFALAMLATVVIVLGGISGGIEKATKIMMPMLFILLFIIIIRSLTLPGAGAGVEYYLIPDFSKINGMVVLRALTQSFFSLGVGWGIMLTYGSYLPKNESIVESSLWVGLMDTSVALLAGLMVFPAVFAFNMEPGSGPTLVFEVLANIFPRMPYGNIAGAFFFLLLFIAAITSTISMVETVGAWLIDSQAWTRKKATWTVGIVAFIVGIPAALSNGTVESLSTVTLFGETGVLNIMDFVFGTVVMLIVVLTTCLYAGWVYDTSKIVDELDSGSPYFKAGSVLGVSPAKLWVFFIRFICPIIIGFVVLNVVGLLG
ncbi:MAG: sodium-dependent transporter [Bacteroidota bacterium]